MIGIKQDEIIQEEKQEEQKPAKQPKVSFLDRITGKKPEEKPAELEPQYYRSATGDQVLNYKVYYMSKLEKVLYFILAFAAGAAVGYLFYGGLALDAFGNPTTATYILNVIVMGVVGFFAGKLYVPIRNKQILGNRQKALRTQFRDMLDALSTSLGAGKNVRDSFLIIQDNMQEQYDEEAFIVNELHVINAGMMNGVNIEELLADFARRSGNADIQDFADVFEICYRQGGNIKETVRNTCTIIGDKMSVAEEIETTISGSKSEQYIMLVMPILLVGMIKLSSPEFGAKFATPAGIIATTIGVVMFVASYFLGKKLLDIKV